MLGHVSAPNFCIGGGTVLGEDAAEVGKSINKILLILDLMMFGYEKLYECSMFLIDFIDIPNNWGFLIKYSTVRLHQIILSPPPLTLEAGCVLGCSRLTFWI